MATIIRNIRPCHKEPSEADFLRLAAEAFARGDGFREVLEVIPAAVYTTDAAGRITFYNKAAAALWGHQPKLGDDHWCGSWKLYWPDGSPLPHDQCPMAVALKEGTIETGKEVVAERPDGSRVPFLASPTLLYDASGTLVGAVNLLTDITEHKLAEQYRQRLASIVESSHDAIVGKDLDGIVTSWNKGAEKLFGYTAEEMIGKPVAIIIPADHPSEEREILRRIRRGEHIDPYETIRQRKDGSLVEISLTVSPIRDAEGRIVGASKIARNITEHRRAQEQQRILLKEMKHRIKNTLAIVQAIAMRTLRSSSEDERAAFTARLQALASAHDLLTPETWDRASLRALVDSVLAPFQEKRRDRFIIDGPDDVWLAANKSLPVAMALHELATNSVKYGSLSNGMGKVHIEWEPIRNSPVERVIFHWRESGGPTVIAPERKGFGSLLIEQALEAELGKARIDFKPEGVFCTLEISL